MVSQNSEFTRKLRAAVRAKIEEYGIDVDDELPDYVMIMVGNKKDKARMKSDLKLFLGDKTTSFVEWLFGFFQKIKTATESNGNVPSSLPSSTAQTTSETKVKSSDEASRRPIEVRAGDELRKTKTSKKSNEHNSKKKEISKTNRHRSESPKSSSQSPIDPRKNKKYHKERDDEEKDRRKSEKKPILPRQINKATTFAIPRPILRSVVVNPQPNLHPRIRARTPSTEQVEVFPTISLPSNSQIEEKFAEEVCPPRCVLVEEKFAEKIRPQRRVLATNSLLFRRALNQSSAVIPEKVEDERKERNEREDHQQEEEEEKEERPLMVKLEERDKERSTIENGRHVDIEEKKKPLQQRCKVVGLGRPPVGIGAIFQRAIQETKKQNETGAEMATTARQAPGMERMSGKRLSANETKIKEEEDDDAEGPNSKKIRIEWESEESGKVDEGNNDGSVLMVNMGKTANRSIRKEAKKPKSGLTLLKEHIGAIGGGGKAALQEVHKEENLFGNKDHIEEENSKKPRAGGQQSPTSSGGRKVELVARKPSSECNSSKNAPLWDGRIEIDDMSSTDDEAEIDAVLEEQHKLRKMALEREMEMKGKELPPTAALTRPLLYQGVPLAEPLLSPGEADLLPATFHQQNVLPSIIPSQQSPQQQQPTSSSIAARPYATVAPCLTTPTVATPTTMIVQQQYHYHQQQQTSALSVMPQQFAHPYSNAAIKTATTFVPMLVRPNQPVGMGYKTPGSISKIYSTPATNPIPTASGIMEKANNPLLPTLVHLREQHRQTSVIYGKKLEEQRLLLAQIQKMPANMEHRKELIFKCKQLEKSASKLKTELEELNEQIVAISKGQPPPQQHLRIKRYF